MACTKHYYVFCLGESVIDGSKLQGKLTLTYKLLGKHHSIVCAMAQAVVTGKNLGLHRMAAKSQLFELVDKHISLKDVDDDKEKTALRLQIVSISTEANVIAPFTSFIGVDPDKQGKPRRCEQMFGNKAGRSSWSEDSLVFHSISSLVGTGECG